MRKPRYWVDDEKNDRDLNISARSARELRLIEKTWPIERLLNPRAQNMPETKADGAKLVEIGQHRKKALRAKNAG